MCREASREKWYNDVEGAMHGYRELFETRGALLEAERVPQDHARMERFDKVLARLLTEWYVVAASVSARTVYSRDGGR